jgi:ABC-2 type transport system permease protein
MIGAVGVYLKSLLEDNPRMADLIARLGGTTALEDAYFFGVMGIFALVASGFAIQSALRLRVEETTLRVDPILAASVGRVQWSMSHLAVALGGSFALLVAAGIAGGLVHGLNTDDIGGQLPRVLSAALVQLPAVWVMVGVAAALFGLFPKQSGFTWGFLGVVVLLGQIGALLELPQWALNLSPFTHVPRLPGEDFSMLPLFIMTGLAAALIALGLYGFRRRDLVRA